MKDYLSESKNAAGKYLDRPVNEAYQAGVSGDVLVMALLMSSYLTLRSIKGGTPEQRKEAFLEMAKATAEYIEGVTKPHS